ncbi:MAG: hypothetical protein NVSMB38_44180 [Ktedonobacteraceae bacterium]
MANLTGQQFGNYRLVRLLGQGGFADVYLAEHIHLASQVAIKILQIRLVGDALDQFRNEGRSIASLIHPNIVRVFDFDVKDDIPFLVMDYAPNGTLRQRYPKGSVLSAVSILPHFKQVALALQYAHDHKLIHRDIKPENMLLGANGEVLLSDFGLVLSAQSTGSQTTKEMAGTLPYMAPEQINGKPRAASDQYALGIILYEWLSGDRPFSGSLIEIATQHLMTPPAPLYGKVPGVSLAIQEVVFTALAKEPLQRFASMQEFVAAFEKVSQAELHASSSLPAVPSIAAAVENTSSYPSSASTYIKTPSSNDSQQSTVINTPDHPQPPAITSPNDSQLPTVPSRPRSPQVPLVPPIQSGQSVQSSNPLSASQPAIPTGGADTNQTGVQPTIPAIISNAGYQTPQRRKGRAGLIILSLLLIIALVVGGVTYAVNTTRGRTTSTTGPVPATSATTVTITPASTDLKNTYTISAVIGKPDATQHQVEARLLSSPTSPQSKTVNATGVKVIAPGTQAQGLLWIFNVGSPVTLSSGTVIPNGPFENGKDYSPKIDMVLDETVTVPSGTISVKGQITVHAHVSKVGTIGNMAMLTGNTGFYHCFCVNGPTAYYYIDNVSYGGVDASFSGGQDQQRSSVVQQSDIDGATNALESAYKPDAQQALQGQVHANEHFVGTPTCNPNVRSDHNAGDVATTVTVTVTFTCTGKVYDQQGALAMAQQWLKQDAAKNPGTAYMLVGKIVPTPEQATDTGQGTIAIPVTAEGVWAFQFSDAQKAQLAHLLAGKSKNDAQSILQGQQGVKQADIQLSGGNSETLPSNPSQITISVQSVAGSG